jgi:hypothetical protein
MPSSFASPYNHHHHSLLLTTIRAPLITWKKEKEVIN